MSAADPSSPLLAALYRGDRSEAERLLARNPSLDIFEAAALDQVDFVEELLTSDPGLADATAPDGFRPLHLAAFFGAPHAARALLAHGADPAVVAENPLRVQPLHSAVAGRHVAITRLLLRAGADPNAKQSQGFTALMAVAHAGHEELVRLLLDAGADPGVSSDDGRTAADMAAADGHDRIVEILAEATRRPPA